MYLSNCVPVRWGVALFRQHWFFLGDSGSSHCTRLQPSSRSATVLSWKQVRSWYPCIIRVRDEVFDCLTCSCKRISKPILWDTTNDLLTRIIRVLRTTKEIWSSGRLSSPLEQCPGYTWVLMKYLGSYIYNYNILHLILFPPDPISIKNMRRWWDITLIIPTPPLPYALPPSDQNHTCFPRKELRGEKAISEEQGAPLAFKPRHRTPHWQQVPSEDAGDWRQHVQHLEELGHSLLCCPSTE